ALTTSFCVDILGMKSKEDDPEVEKRNIRIRRRVHLGISAVFVAIILIIEAIGSDSIITAIYKLASYTYGPLLGLYFCGLYTKVKPVDNYVPYVAFAAPVLCFVIEIVMKTVFHYTVGYELLLINGALTAFGLWMISSKNRQSQSIQKP
ncbi:MAG: sodium:solute symporter, partial [Dysgonamonadaceae bacterium]|nr:sodium:solute symporter [Dysgonamonadaceae bacterium]